MTDAEFRAAIVRALNLPVPDSEADYHGCQCADDYSRVYMARVWDVVQDADEEDRAVDRIESDWVHRGAQ